MLGYVKDLPLSGDPWGVQLIHMCICNGHTVCVMHFPLCWLHGGDESATVIDDGSLAWAFLTPSLLWRSYFNY